MKHSTAADICRKVYAETRDFYAATAPCMGERARGFRILYGPPTSNAPVLFLGYQPGGRTVEAATHHNRWPDHCEYATATWPLAKRLREVWDAPTLSGCTGLNAIFFRAPRVRAWLELPTQLRNKMEEFSLSRTERIIRALAPRRVIVVGLGTFDRLTSGTSDTLDSGRVLLRHGELWGVPAIGVLHLSGARVRRDEMKRIVAYFDGLNRS